LTVAEAARGDGRPGAAPGGSAGWTKWAAAWARHAPGHPPSRPRPRQCPSPAHPGAGQLSATKAQTPGRGGSRRSSAALRRGRRSGRRLRASPPGPRRSLEAFVPGKASPAATPDPLATQPPRSRRRAPASHSPPARRAPAPTRRAPLPPCAHTASPQPHARSGARRARVEAAAPRPPLARWGPGSDSPARSPWRSLSLALLLALSFLAIAPRSKPRVPNPAAYRDCGWQRQSALGTGFRLGFLWKPCFSLSLAIFPSSRRSRRDFLVELYTLLIRKEEIWGGILCSLRRNARSPSRIDGE
jgi:hypothetical protein